MHKTTEHLHLQTKLMVAGNGLDIETNAVIPPLHFSTTFAQDYNEEDKGFDYSRTKNPTRSRLEEAYAAIENARYAVSVGSGMAAETIILHSLAKGSHILASNQIYGGSYRLFTRVFSSIHRFTFAPLNDLNALEEMLKKETVHVIWMESPTNPLLQIVDIKAIASLAKKYNVRTVIDNTFATPVAQNPLDMGVDVVFHSATKYLNGHSDVIAGCVMLNDKAWYEQLFFLHNAMGTTQSPMDSWLILRGLKTLDVRMERHQRNAMDIARFLESHPQVKQVFYPGLPSHPQHLLASSQMRNLGGMLSIRLESEKKALTFFSRLQLFHLAVSLGGVESLVGYPVKMTHASMPKETRESLGITPDLVRISVGIENVDDLKNDLDFALS